MSNEVKKETVTMTLSQALSGEIERVLVGVYYPAQNAVVADVTLPGTVHITFAGGHCGDAACTRCDPMERYVDGLTVHECLARYEARMAEELRDYDSDHWDMKRDTPIPIPLDNPTWQREQRYPRGFRLNDAQLSAARTAWSSALRAKQAEARAKERVCAYWEGNEDE